ncbi:MAG: hypothetical protein ACREP6_15295 [Candidatus Binataceae bacterium]
MTANIDGVLQNISNILNVLKVPHPALRAALSHQGEGQTAGGVGNDS